MGTDARRCCCHPHKTENIYHKHPFLLLLFPPHLFYFPELLCAWLTSLTLYFLKCLLLPCIMSPKTSIIFIFPSLLRRFPLIVAFRALSAVFRRHPDGQLGALPRGIGPRLRGQHTLRKDVSRTLRCHQGRIRHTLVRSRCYTAL